MNFRNLARFGRARVRVENSDRGEEEGEREGSADQIDHHVCVRELIGPYRRIDG